MAVVQCTSCGGRGVDLVQPPHTQCAHCRRQATTPSNTRTQGPLDSTGIALWTRHHLPQLTNNIAWASVAGLPRETRVLALPPGLDAETCVRMAPVHGFAAEAVERTACTCPLGVSVWTWLRGCTCPVETWIEYRKSPALT